MSTRADDVASADGQPPLAGRAGHLPVESLPGHLDADAERLLIGVSVYREPADRNAVLFQVGMRDWTAARAPDRQGPAPPYQPPADLAGMLATCQASGLLVVASSPGCDATADDWHSVFVEAWLASQLHRLLTAAGRGAELTNAHQRAARYWQWRSAAWPQGRRADLHDLLEARHHLFDSGDGDQASALTEAVCAQLHAWGDLGRETALIHETLDRLPARSAGRAAWIRELGRIAEVRGDHADAERRYQQALDMFATAGDRAGVSRSYHSLGVLAQARGDYSKAERRYLQSAEAADQPGASAAAPSVWPPQDAAAAAAAQAPHPGPAAAVPAAAAAPHALGAEPRRTAAGGASDDLDLAAARWSITRVTASRPAMTPVTMPKAAARRTGAGSTAPRSGVAAPDPPDPPGRPARSPRAPGSPRVPRPARHPRPARPASPVSPARPVSPASPAAAGHRYRPRRAWRQLPALAATAAGVVALAVAVLSVQLFGVFAGPSGGRSDAGRTGPARPGAVGPGLVPAVRKDAALWVKDQVNRSAIIACDQAMCSALQAQGVPAGSLFALGPGSGDPLASNVVVATTAVRSQFGVRLAAVYAPVVVASFGAGSARIEVRVVAPDGSAAYLGALRTDLLARRSAGAQLLLNRRISVAGLARRQLTAGLVDSRLLMTLAVLARMHALRIVSFSGGPGAGQEVPLPIVEVTGSRPGQSTGYLEPMVTFLHAQRPPFLAASVRAQLLTDGQTALRIDFADPGPLGLLTGGNSAIPITNHK